MSSYPLVSATFSSSFALGALVDIPANAKMVTFKFRSCETFFINQAGVDEQACRTIWVFKQRVCVAVCIDDFLQASMIDNIAFNCQATQNAHGGLCVPDDQLWFMQ